jgi:hypothetical protein
MVFNRDWAVKDARGIPDFHPDPAVTVAPPAGPHLELGRLARGNPQQAAQFAGRLAPGEDQPAALVPPRATRAVTKGMFGTDGIVAPGGSFGENRVSDEWPSPSTSGTRGPVADGRFERRPDHGVAAGHADLLQQPGGRLAAPRQAQYPQPATHPGWPLSGRSSSVPADGSPPSPLRAHLEAQASTVGVSRLDLQAPADSGWMRQLRVPVDPTPSQVNRQPGLNDAEGPRQPATRPADVPYPPGSPAWGGPGPLADALGNHAAGSPSLFGFTPDQATCNPPGWG